MKTQLTHAFEHSDSHSVIEAVAERFANVSGQMVQQLKNVLVKKDDELLKTLALPDLEFLCSTLATLSAENAFTHLSPEKAKLLRRANSQVKFFNHIKANGGLLSSAEAAKFLGVDKVTVKRRKDTHKLLAIHHNGEYFYPTFQFVESDNREQRVVNGMAEILPLIARFSGVMQYGFFTQPRTMLDRKVEPFTVKDMLREGVTESELHSILRLAKLFGSADAE